MNNNNVKDQKVDNTNIKNNKEIDSMKNLINEAKVMLIEEEINDKLKGFIEVDVDNSIKISKEWHHTDIFYMLEDFKYLLSDLDKEYFKNECIELEANINTFEEKRRKLKAKDNYDKDEYEFLSYEIYNLKYDTLDYLKEKLEDIINTNLEIEAEEYVMNMSL